MLKYLSVCIHTCTHIHVIFGLPMGKGRSSGVHMSSWGWVNSIFALLNSRALTSAGMRAFTWQRNVQCLMHLVTGVCMPTFSDGYLVFKNAFCFLLSPLYFSLVTEGQAGLHHYSSPHGMIPALRCWAEGGAVRVRMGAEVP